MRYEGQDMTKYKELTTHYSFNAENICLNIFIYFSCLFIYLLSPNYLRKLSKFESQVFTPLQILVAQSGIEPQTL